MPTTTQLPEHFGRYRVLRKLGEGGMGAVYLAEDSELARQVAIKIPHFTEDDGPEVIERFRREARVAAGIDHPNICAVYDVGQIDGIQYISMPFVDAVPLAKYIQPNQPWPVERAVALTIRLATALQVVHSRGIMHRDLKPANIMLRPGDDPVIMDFGLARSVSQTDRMTRTGAPVGTPAYMSPEQVLGEKAIDSTTDIFSLGVIFYQLITGNLPFAAPYPAIYFQIAHESFPLPSNVRPVLDQALDAICLKAMAKQAVDRYATMAEFAAALRTCLGSWKTDTSSPIETVPQTLPETPVLSPLSTPMMPTPTPANRDTERPVGPRRRTRWHRMIGIAVIIVAILGVAWILRAMLPAQRQEIEDAGTATKDETQRPHEGSSKPEQARMPPRILQHQIWTWNGAKESYAKYSDLTFSVGIGNRRDGRGCADAGVEIEHIRRIGVSVETSVPLGSLDDNSFAGFFVDYHTKQGYSKRVALSVGMYSTKRSASTPVWGKRKPPDQFIDILRLYGRNKRYDIDLKQWAPPEWDGKVWFVVSLQNTGQNTHMEATLRGPQIEALLKESPRRGRDPKSESGGKAPRTLSARQASGLTERLPSAEGPHTDSGQVVAVAYYRFEEGSGRDVVNSVTGHIEGSHTGSYSANVPADPIPKANARNKFSLEINGSTAAFVTSQPFIFHKAYADATLEFWVFPLAPEGYIFWTRPLRADTNGFNIFLGPGSYLAVDYREPNSALHRLMPENTTFAVPLNTWTHVAIVRTTNTYRFYRNGVLVHTATDTDPHLPDGTAWAIGGPPKGAFIGLIDEVRFVDKALPPSEFLYAVPAPLSRPE
jgi:serine/threonine protein kinase